MPRLLLLNPNITVAVTTLMLKEAQRVASPGTELVPVTVRFGAQYIEGRVEAAIAGHAVLDALAEHAPGCDGAIVAAFGDPGLHAAKEMLDIPVIGISEAAFLTAHLLGNRHAIVCLTKRHATWYRECAMEHGLDRRLVAVHPLKVPVQDITQAKEKARDELLKLCHRAVVDDDAEVIIVGGGPLAGLARDLASEIPVPIVDGVSAAVRLAEALVGLHPRAPTMGSFSQPPPKPTQGLSPPLAGWVEGRPREKED